VPTLQVSSTIMRLVAEGNATAILQFLQNAPQFDTFLLVGVNGPAWVSEISSILQAASVALANDGGKLTASEAFDLIASTGLVPQKALPKLEALLPVVLTLIEGGHVSTGQAFMALGAFFLS
jgi:hypothetical protein